MAIELKGTTSERVGLPVVRVPVLSKITAVTSWAVSRADPPVHACVCACVRPAVYDRPGGVFNLGCAGSTPPRPHIPPRPPTQATHTPTFDEDAVGGSDTGADHDRGGGRQAQCARTGDHDHTDGKEQAEEEGRRLLGVEVLLRQLVAL